MTFPRNKLNIHLRLENVTLIHVVKYWVRHDTGGKICTGEGHCFKNEQKEIIY